MREEIQARGLDKGRTLMDPIRPRAWKSNDSAESKYKRAPRAECSQRAKARGLDYRRNVEKLSLPRLECEDTCSFAWFEI